MEIIFLGTLLVACGIIYQINPNLFKRWFWTRTSIAQRLLSSSAYEKYMKGLGFVYIAFGIGLIVFALNR